MAHQSARVQVDRLLQLGAPVIVPGDEEINMKEYKQAYSESRARKDNSVYFHVMLRELRKWREQYYTAIVPQKVRSVPGHPGWDTAIGL